jgi:hypothetical protein
LVLKTSTVASGGPGRRPRGLLASPSFVQSREVALIRTAPCPLLYLERHAYLDALHAAEHGLDSARVALARGLQRHRGA